MTEFRLPDIGDGLTEAEVVRWLVPEGAEVGRDEPLVEVETDKAVVVIPSPVGGIVTRHGAAQGDSIAVGSVLAVIGDPNGAPDAQSSPPNVPSEDDRSEGGANSNAGQQAPTSVKALPVVRRLAREHGVDLGTITGSGPGGRITRQDVLTASQTPPPSLDTDSFQPESTDRPPKSRPLTKLHRTIAANMARSWAEIPHVTTFDQVDATRLLGVRSALSKRHDTNISVDALVIAAVIPALRRFCEFNATLEGDALVMHSACHVGVAINAPEGLLVGVARDAQNSTVMQLAEATARLAERGKARNLGVNELTGQTFTVSNIGALGGGYGTPIIPPDNTAILAVGKIADTPVVEAGELVARPVMPLSLSFDHRVIDGALSRRFMDMVIENLCEPALFLA